MFFNKGKCIYDGYHWFTPNEFLQNSGVQTEWKLKIHNKGKNIETLIIRKSL